MNHMMECRCWLGAGWVAGSLAGSWQGGWRVVRLWCLVAGWRLELATCTM